MNKTLIAATCVALTSFATLAHADEDAAITTGAGGAMTGAIVGGPVGAVIGGALGVAAGSALNPPPREVVTYVEEQPEPAARVVVEQPVVVGEALPEDIVVMRVPSNEDYAYAIVNDRRVIVDPETNTVVQVLH